MSSHFFNRTSHFESSFFFLKYNSELYFYILLHRLVPFKEVGSQTCLITMSGFCSAAARGQAAARLLPGSSADPICCRHPTALISPTLTSLASCPQEHAVWGGPDQPQPTGCRQEAEPTRCSSSAWSGSLHTFLSALTFPKCIAPKPGPSLDILSKQTEAGR